MTGVSPADLAAFIQIFEASDWDEADVIVGNDELHLRKLPGAPLVVRYGPLPARSTEGGPCSEIVAPHIATFYRGTALSEIPLVAVGQSVKPETEIGRLMVLSKSTMLLAGAHGTVREICASEGALVEYGQVLLLIEPDAA